MKIISKRAQQPTVAEDYIFGLGRGTLVNTLPSVNFEDRQLPPPEERDLGLMGEPVTIIPGRVIE